MSRFNILLSLFLSSFHLLISSIAPRKQYVGGQAVIEGVMMKTADRLATAVRTVDGAIKVIEQRFLSWTERSVLLRLPFIRGVVFLIEMLVLGMKTLTWSANQQVGEDEHLGATELAFTMLFSFGFAIVLFIAVPFWLSAAIVETRGLWFNLLDGLFRLAVFLGYLAAISLMPDVRRLFQYHGAEHKTVNCYEAKDIVAPSRITWYPLEHPRCGTSLVVFVIAISVVVFSVVRFDAWYVNIPFRILLLPVVAGVSYELLRFTGTRQDNRFLYFISRPGMWVQGLTTREPDSKQMAVAAEALKRVV